MRLDKYLWCVRYFKTRAIATEECKKNRVKVNGETAKASRDVGEGDQIGVRKNQMNYSFLILQVPQSRIGAKLVSLHIKDITPKEEYDAYELRKLSQDYYRIKGEGRPTKKDRRSLDGFLTIDETPKSDDE